MLLVVVIYAFCVWIASSLLRGKGILVVAVGVLALVFALRAARRGRLALLHRLVFLAILSAAGVLLTEAVLRLAPGLLSGAVANAAFSGYHGERDGIYDEDPHLAKVMRPDFERPMYWNGHWWRHRTNSRGFRGPMVDHAEAVFLGDSMVYGHGVEDEDTVPAQFAHATGLSRANLGVQGSSPMQALEMLRRVGLPLRPRYVFLCVHPNDVSDPLEDYEAAELERFVREAGYRPVAVPRGSRTLFDAWLEHAALPLATARALRAAAFVATRAGDAPPTDEVIPPAVFVESDLGWAVLRQAIREIDRESRRAGARLVVFDLGYPAEFTAAVASIAGDQGIQYSDAGRVAWRRALAGEDVYLRHDGHWSPRGSAIVAAALAQAVQELRSSPREVSRPR